MEPVYLLESTPPKVSSPLALESVVVGANETATEFREMVPWESKLSVTGARSASRCRPK